MRCNCLCYHIEVGDIRGKLNMNMKLNYRRIFFDVIQHFSDGKVLYVLMAVIFLLLWVFLASVSLNKELMTKDSIDIENLYKSMHTTSNFAMLFAVLSLFGAVCYAWLSIQDFRIRQSIKKYNLSVIK